MPDSKRAPSSKYFIEAVSKALDILDTLDGPDKELSLTQVAKKLRLSRSSAFRFLFTLESKGWVERTANARRFRRTARGPRLGYAMLGAQFTYSVSVTRGLEEAAKRHRVNLLVTDNCQNPEIAILNAQMFVEQGVDLVVESQADERAAPIISHLLAKAGIPTIAIDIPQPGAVFFGANNFQAGLLAGRALGEHARAKWSGCIEKLILLDRFDAGNIPQARMTGALQGVKEMINPASRFEVIRVDSGATDEQAYQVCRNVFAAIPSPTALLVAAINDRSAAAAVQALRDLTRLNEAAVVGHNGGPGAFRELLRPETCLIGSVAYFPENYGQQVLGLALKILAGEAISPAVYMEHVVIDKNNLHDYYPNAFSSSATRDDQSAQDCGAPLPVLLL